MSQLRSRLVRQRDAVAEANRRGVPRPARRGSNHMGVFSFTAKEVRAIVDAAVTPRERVVLLLLLTTGLRLGGLARMRRPCVSPIHHARDVPVEWITIEKNHRTRGGPLRRGRPAPIRQIHMSDACRILVARFLRGETPTTFLFASPQGQPSHPG